MTTFTSEPAKYNKAIVIKMMVAFFVVILLVSYCTRHHKRSGKDENAVNTVVVAKVSVTDVPVYLPALGTVTPTDNITVKSQVSGLIQTVKFKEGQKVKQGDLLVQIDPRPFIAQLTQYQGQLQHDQALLANAKIDLARYKMLFPLGAATKQTLDTQASLVNQYQGTVIADQGLVSNAEINLGYTRITSPIAGRVGLRLVDPGNLVQSSDVNGLVVINEIDPITVIFAIPEDNIPAILTEVNKGKTLIVEVYDRIQHTLIATGALLTLDNAIDPTTGTIKLKALFHNPKDALYPNQFVNVKLRLLLLKNALVAPTAAVQHGVDGIFVFVYDKNTKMVHTKPVTIGAEYNDLTVIKSGINLNDIVITEGVENLSDGSIVNVPSLQSKPDKAVNNLKNNDGSNNP